MNMFSVYYVHHLNSEMEGNKSTKVPKSTPGSINQASKSDYKMSILTVKILQFFCCGQVQVDPT